MWKCKYFDTLNKKVEWLTIHADCQDQAAWKADKFGWTKTRKWQRITLFPITEQLN